MDTTEIKTETPDTFEINPEDFNITSDAIKLEFSEIGDPVPFKIITEEHGDGESNTYRMEVPVPNAWMTNAMLNQAGPSNADQLATDPESSNPPPHKRLKMDLKVNTRRHRLRLENNESMEIMSSDDDAFSEESDMECGEDSENESECEYISDDEPPRAGDQGDHRYDGAHVDKKSEDVWWAVNRPEWTIDDSSMKNIEFTKKRELFKLTPKTPYETFRWLLNDQILDTIVNATNKYAANIFQKKKIAPSSRYWSWKDVTREELITFLALLLHTGTIRTNRLCDYWKGDYLFNLNCFSRFMTRNRFMLILNCLHFTSPDSKTSDNVAKIRPFIDHFNNVMKEIYYPGKELLIAKSMVFWHGRLVRQEYTDHRRHRNAVNLFKLAEPDGIVVKFQVYAGKSSENIFRVSTGRIVEELVADKLGSGHSLYMDRYYNSYRLALTLLKGQTYCTGTLNKKTRYNPFIGGGVSQTSFFSKGVHVGKWQGRKSTLYITTEFKNQLHQVIEKNGTLSQKPKALTNFARFMTASELQDQLMSYMPCSRKMMRWYKKVFIYALQIYMNNAFHLYNNFSGITKKIRYYEYRLAVLKAMLPPPIHRPPADELAGPTSHRLKKMTRTRLREKKEKDGRVRIVNEVVRKECRLCRRNKRRTATQYECVACEGSPAYCATCFCETHVSTRDPDTTDIDDN